MPVVPHLTLFWHFLRPRTYEEWLSYDLHLMRAAMRCFAFPRSNGADGEVSYALAHGLPVIYARTAAVEDCVASIREWLQVQPKCFSTRVIPTSVFFWRFVNE